MTYKNIQGLRTCIYKVGDLEKAKQWYSKAFDSKPTFDEVFYVGFNIKGFELGLLPEEKPTQIKTDTVLTYWGVDSIEEAYQHLLECGAKEHEAPNNVGGELMLATVKDPWGNIIGIIYNPYFKIES
ncbi:MAG: VOC family protein [Bacteroidia bacterium]